MQTQKAVPISSNDGFVRAWCRGGSVTVRYWNTNSDILTRRDSVVIVGVIPEGYRPPTDAAQLCNIEDDCRGMLLVGTDGKVCIVHYNGANVHRWSYWRASLTYAIA